MSITPDRLAYSPTELADALGCTRQHVQNLIARNELESIKLGGKRLIAASVVAELLTGSIDIDRHLRAIESAAPELDADDIDRLRALLAEAEAGLVAA